MRHINIPKFNTRISELRAYIEEHGKLPGSETRYRGRCLGGWCTAMRALNNKGELPSYCIAILNTIPGWSWYGRNETRWYRKWELFRRYIMLRQDVGVDPYDIRRGRRYSMSDGILDTWSKRQRDLYYSGNLPADRIAMMERLPGWTW